MNDDTELSDEVIAAVDANRKIDAIKLLRKEKNLDLKQAKEIVDTYISNRPAVAPAQSRHEGFNFTPLILAVIVTAAAYFAYKTFT